MTTRRDCTDSKSKSDDATTVKATPEGDSPLGVASHAESPEAPPAAGRIWRQETKPATETKGESVDLAGRRPPVPVP